MPCYRDGGCGPYEGRPCNQCPASDPSYLDDGRLKALKEKFATLEKLQDRLEVCINGVPWHGTDADTVLADSLGIVGNDEINGLARQLCRTVANARSCSDLEGMFSIMSDMSLDTYADSAIKTVKQALNDLSGEQPTRHVRFTVQCMATYEASMDVPAGLQGDALADYIKGHLDSVGAEGLSYVPDSDSLDEESITDAEED